VVVKPCGTYPEELGAHVGVPVQLSVMVTVYGWRPVGQNSLKTVVHTVVTMAPCGLVVVEPMRSHSWQ